MRLIKVSPKHQITIPKNFRPFCATGWLVAEIEKNRMTLRAVEIAPAKTEQEILDKILNEAGLSTKQRFNGGTEGI